MDVELLKELSQADSIAAHEDEVRTIIKRELSAYQETFQFDGLGSLIVTKKSPDPEAPTLMFAAHMDEVGFMVRYLSDIGMVYLQPLGSVEARAKHSELVRLTTGDGRKIEGVLNSVEDGQGQITDTYVDFGFDSREALVKAGISVGDMVVFASDFRTLAAPGVVAGKAMDDRAGCFALVKAMQALTPVTLPVNVVAAFTSSEEVGTRGGRLTSKLVAPDVFFAIDVAKNPELDRGFKNTRKIGAGPMLEFYDRTMVPNPKLLQQLQQTATAANLPYQKDMFKGGGTDAGLAHLENGGTAAAVLGIPLRYCHDPYSLAHVADLQTMSQLVQTIVKTWNQATVAAVYKF